MEANEWISILDDIIAKQSKYDNKEIEKPKLKHIAKLIADKYLEQASPHVNNEDVFKKEAFKSLEDYFNKAAVVES